MNILIDTQILVWSFDINSPLTKQHKVLLEDISNRIIVRQISLMELAIKKNIKKLPDFVPDISVVAKQIAINGFELINLSDEHIFCYQHLPLFNEHRDPFDRFLVAIAQQEKLVILSTDTKFQLYAPLVQVIN